MKASRAIKVTALVAVASALCGCLHAAGDRTVSPEDYGYAVGTAAYIGYCRVAEGKGDEFRGKVAAIWGEVNAIDSADTLASDVARIAARFAEVEGDETLTDAERAALRALAGMVLSRVDGKLAEQALGHADAVAFLRGVRAGVNAAAGL